MKEITPIESRIEELEAALNAASGAGEQAQALLELSTELRDTDTKRALTLAEDALSLFTELGDAEGIADSFYTLGVCHRWLSNHAAASEMLNQAAHRYETAGNFTGLCKVKNWLGNLAAEQERYQDALRLLDESRSLAVRLNDKTAEAHALNNIGLVHNKCGDTQAAVEVHLQAMRLREATGDRYNLGATYNNLGLLYEKLGDYPAALDFLFKAYTINETFQNGRGKAFVLNNLSIVYRKLGDESTALACLLQSLSISEQLGEKVNAINALLNIANHYYRHAKYAAALTYTLRGLNLARELKLHWSECAALLNLGCISQKLGDFDDAAAHFSAALTAARQAGDKGGEADALCNTGLLLVETHRFADALSPLTQSVTLSEAGGEKEQQQRAHAALGAAYKALGNLQKSAAHLRLAEQLQQGLHNSETDRKTQALIVRHELEKAEHSAGLYGLRREDLSHIARVLTQSAHASTVTESVPSDMLGKTSLTKSASETGAVKITVQTFGAFSVDINGRQLKKEDWARKKSRDVFKVLLLNYRQAVTIDELIDTLWGDGAGEQSSKGLEPTLMNAVSSLRKALEPQLGNHKTSRFIHASDKSYTLDLGGDALIDFIEFKRSIQDAKSTAHKERKRTAYTRAVSLYTGTFLKEDLYAEWAAFERESLQESYLNARLYLAQSALDESAFDKSALDTLLLHAEKILDLDATNEAAYLLLFTALSAANRTADIGKLSARCKAAFQKEYRTPPPKSLDRFLMPR